MTEARKRCVLAVVAACFTVIGIANLYATTSRRWAPNIVAALSFVAAVFAVWLLVDRRSVIAYRWGGTAAIGALLFRVVSLSFGLVNADDEDAIPFTVANAALTLMLVTLYSRWWLTDVKSWHEAWKRRDK